MMEKHVPGLVTGFTLCRPGYSGRQREPTYNRSGTLADFARHHQAKIFHGSGRILGGGRQKLEGALITG